MAQQPLNNRIAIVDKDGNPTPYFIRMLQERGITLDDKISAAEAQALIDAWASDRDIIAGDGLSGGGNLSSDVTIDLDAVLNDLNDVDLTIPPTDGQVLGYDAMAAVWKAIDQSGGGGPGSWELIAAQTVTPAAPNFDFINLDAYGEILVLGYNLTTSASAFRFCRLSVDNGTTFYSTSGDYLTVDVNGVVANASDIGGHSTAATAARTIKMHLLNNVAGVIKVSEQDGGLTRLFVASTAVVNAIRVQASTGNLTGGTIYVLGRTGGAGGAGTVESVDVESNIPGIDATGGPVTSTGVIDLDLTDADALRTAIGAISHYRFPVFAGIPPEVTYLPDGEIVYVELTHG
jgi:hypothetical protein